MMIINNNTFLFCFPGLFYLKVCWVTPRCCIIWSTEIFLMGIKNNFLKKHQEDPTKEKVQHTYMDR